MIPVKSTLDNNEYLVRNVDKNCVYTPEKAANILANMRQTCIKFISTLNDKFLSGHDKMTSGRYNYSYLLDFLKLMKYQLL